MKEMYHLLKKKAKKCRKREKLFFVGVLKVTDEKSRIRRQSQIRIR
jgi:hypothetical protein